MMFVIEFFLSIFIAVIIGRLVSKLKLPSILGWLIAGMILGPHALSLLNQQLLDATLYEIIVHILECSDLSGLHLWRYCLGYCSCSCTFYRTGISDKRSCHQYVNSYGSLGWYHWMCCIFYNDSLDRWKTLCWKNATLYDSSYCHPPIDNRSFYWHTNWFFIKKYQKLYQYIFSHFDIRYFVILRHGIFY